MNAMRHSETSCLPRQRVGAVASRLVMRIGAEDCAVRVTPIARIEDVLGFEEELQAAAAGLAAEQEACVPTGEAALVAELLEARMIAPLRPRRRRDRAVSSRAVFYAAAEG